MATLDNKDHGNALNKAGERLQEVQQNWTFMRGAFEAMEDEDTTISFLRHALTVISGFVGEADVYEAVQGQVRGEQASVTFYAKLSAICTEGPLNRIHIAVEGIRACTGRCVSPRLWPLACRIGYGAKRPWTEGGLPNGC